MFFSKQDRQNWEKSNGRLFNPAWRSGRTTKIMFETFADCYKERGSWIEIKDHSGKPEINRYVTILMEEMADNLGLTFEFKKEAKTNRYFVRLPPEV